MPEIVRSALVEHSAARMFALVNDIAAYPRRFDWCRAASVLETGEDRMLARLELGVGGFHLVHHRKRAGAAAPSTWRCATARSSACTDAGNSMHWTSPRAR